MGMLARPRSLAELGGFTTGAGHSTPIPARAFGDAVLDATVTPGARRPAGLDSVLLTGASGFLGAYLVHELAFRLGVRVLCLVRATDRGAARARIATALRRYGLWSPALMRRVIAVPGDLGAPRFGLTNADYEQLAAAADAIVHNGARVNHAESYERLRVPNVLGTVSVLRLACHRGAIPVHFVSSTSVAARPHGPVPERVPERPGDASGYVVGKWVGEMLMTQAAARGLPVLIHRPDRVCGPAGTGATGTDDAFWTVIRAIARLGMAPSAPPEPLSLVPADYVAGAIAYSVAHPPDRHRHAPVHHLVNHTSIPVGTVLDRLSATGIPVRSVPVPQFLTALSEAARTDLGIARALIISSLSGPGPCRWDDTNARRALARSGISCPPMSRDLIDRHLEHLIETGFLPRPVKVPEQLG